MRRQSDTKMFMMRGPYLEVEIGFVRDCFVVTMDEENQEM